MMYVVLCVIVAFACLLNMFVWFVCDLLCDVVWYLCLSHFVSFGCVCVLFCSIVRLRVLFVMCCVMLSGVFFCCC